VIPDVTEKIIHNYQKNLVPKQKFSFMNNDDVCAWNTEHHMNCDKPFDGHGGELAHSWTGGDIHFDEDENYKRDDPTGSGINLLKVGLH